MHIWKPLNLFAQKEAGVFNECTLFWVTDTSHGDMLCTREVCFGNFP